MVLDRIEQIEQTLRDIMEFGGVRETIQKAKEQQQKAIDEAQKKMFDKVKADQEANRKAAIEAAQKEGRQPPTYGPTNAPQTVSR